MKWLIFCHAWLYIHHRRCIKATFEGNNEEGPTSHKTEIEPKTPQKRLCHTLTKENLQFGQALHLIYLH